MPPLDLSRLHADLQRMARYVEEQRGDFSTRLANALALVRENADGGAFARLQQRVETHGGRYTWPVAGLREPLDTVREPPTGLPEDYMVLAVDGSQIEPSRDALVSCYLVNVGRVTLRYGASPQARLESVPSIRFRETDLVVRDRRNGVRQQTIEGALLAAKRDTAEVQALAEMAEALPADTPAIGLLDGSFTQWTVSGAHQAVQEQVLAEYLDALDRLERVATERPFAVASYISRPRSQEAVNALRLARCPFDVPDCRTHCGHFPDLERPCDDVARVRDRDVFGGAQLSPGARSVLFDSRAPATESYGAHAVSFFYINTGLPRSGPETARVEVPGWSLGRLDLLHALLWDQIQLGGGFPLAIAEAHEQAVVRSADQDLFWQMVESIVSAGRLTTGLSQKNVAKRRRSV